MSSYTAGQFYKDEYNRLDSKQKQVDGVLKSRSRLSALNDSYRKRYSKYIEIMMVLIIAYAVYLGVSLLQSSVPAIPYLVVDIVIVILMALLTIYLFNTIVTLQSRDVLDYDELDIPPVQDDKGIIALDASGLANKVKRGRLGPEGEDCVGPDCCPNTPGAYWNPDTNKCDGESPATESFATIEFSTVAKAYTDLSVQDSSLKRAPISGPVGMVPSSTSLEFSSA